MRILMRASQTPFDNLDAFDTIANNRIWGNVGNLLFATSVYKTLYSSETTVDVYKKVNIQDAEMINEKYDYFILPFANAFRKDFIPELKRYTNLIKKLRIPCIVVGVGLQGNIDYSSNDVFSFDDDVRDFCAAVLEKSCSIGVRGAFTEDYLKRLGFNYVQVIGCPSMYMFGSKLPRKNIYGIDANSRIAVNCKDDNRRIIEYLLGNGYNYTFFSQPTKELRLIYSGKKFSDELRDYPHSLTSFLFDENRIVFPLNVKTWLDSLGECKFSIGSRIHGNIAAILGGCPAYVICTDSRTLELCEFYEIPHARESQFNYQENFESLFERTDFDKPYKNHAKRYENYLKFLKDNGLNPVTEPFDDFNKIQDSIRYNSVVRPINCTSNEELSYRLNKYYDYYENKIKRLEDTISKMGKKVGANV